MSHLDPAIRDKVMASFAAQSLMQTFAARIDALDRGTCHISAPIVPGARQQAGYAHAGLTFALGDTAAGYAALAVMPAEAEVVTAEMKINLLAPGTGDRLIAESRVVRPGRRLVVAAADVYAETGDSRRHIAVLTGTLIPILP